jgi:tetratricopeptide (TPR) repeat protein
LCIARSGDADAGFTLLLDEIDRDPLVRDVLLPAILVLQAQVKPSEEMFEKIDDLMSRVETEEPVSPETIRSLADYWILRGQPERAIPLYEKGLTLDNLNETQAFVFRNNLAMLYSQVLGQHQRALVVVDQALATRRDNITLLNTKGLILINAGRPAEAIPILQRAVELPPHRLPIYYMHLAYALHLDGRVALARREFDAVRDSLIPLISTMSPQFVKERNKAMYDVLMLAYP